MDIISTKGESRWLNGYCWFNVGSFCVEKFDPFIAHGIVCLQLAEKLAAD